jgi:RNA polymerase sigma factor (sigma-70 family)
MKSSVIQPIATLFDVGTLAAMPDGPLLERFVAGRDGLAFEAIVARHGPMVLNVCRRILPEHSDVEDAFQATFLVLVRKAGTLRDRHRLGPWLYGVAHRVARRARSQSASRRSRERPETGEPEPAVESESCEDLEGRELLAVLDEELARLPEKYRSVVVLCDLEGRTYDEAARHLECALGTLKSRLASARDRLRRRLIRRGVAPAAAALAAGLAASSASAAAPASLARATVDVAVQCLSARSAAAAAAAASVSTLAEGVLRTMYLSRLRTIGAVLLAVGASAAGLGVLAQAQRPTQTPPQTTNQTQSPPSTRFDDAIRGMEERLRMLRQARDAELARLASQDRTAAWVVKLGGRVERDVVSINLVATAVTDDDLKMLSAFPSLQTVHLHHNQIGDAGVANMQGLKNLTTLDLFDTRVTDAGLVHLAEWMPYLQWLDLNDTKITDAGLRHLKGLKHLRRLDVRKTNVTEAGVEELRRALPGAEILH